MHQLLKYKVDRLDVNGSDGIVNPGNLGVNTSSITNQNIAGVGNSFHGMYLADGFIAFSTSLHNPSGYYIGENVNALECWSGNTCYYYDS